MKSLLLMILGAIVGWGLYSFITGEFESSVLFVLIIGLVTGYEVGKRQKGA